MTRLIVVLVGLAAMSGCRASRSSGEATVPAPDPAAAGTKSPYREQLDSPVRGLSAQEVDDLLSGRGMGLARAAELSGYPGPRHVLDLAAELALDESQKETAQAIFERMLSEAKALGGEIVERERALGQSFLDRTATEASVAEATAAIAALQGKLRAVHLRAHLDLTAALEPKQIARYAELRGYTGTSGHMHMH